MTPELRLFFFNKMWEQTVLLGKSSANEDSGDFLYHLLDTLFQWKPMTCDIPYPWT